MLFLVELLGASLIINNATITLNNAVLIVSSDVIINGGLNAGNSTIFVGRNWSRTGSFDSGTSTVVFFTTQLSTITGSTTFYNFVCEEPGKEIQFQFSSTQGVINILTLKGAFGNRIRLRSTLNGSKWIISLVSTQAVNFVDVRDSDAINRTITCFGSVDSGNNNSNWIFAFSSPSVSNLILKDLSDNVINTDMWTNKSVLIASFTLSDFDGDNVRYYIQISTLPNFSSLYISSVSGFITLGTTFYQLPPLSIITTHYIRIWAEDTTSRFSSTVTYFLDNPLFPARFGFDNVPPSAISNLAAAIGSVDGDVRLTWSAPSDNSNEPVYSGFYEIKVATYQITSGNYDSITHNPFFSFIYLVSTTAVAPNTLVGHTITGLYPGTTYHFAIKTIDRASNKASWTRTQAINHLSSAPASDIPPQAPPGVSASPAGSNSVFVQWDLPPINGTDDRDFYRIFYATFSFTSRTQQGVVQITTVAHPSNSFTHVGLAATLTHYYRIVTVDKGSSGDLFSQVFESALSVIASTVPAPSAALRVTAVYDDRSDNNINNYGIVDGIEDADGIVTFQWPKVVGGGTIQSYEIQVSTDKNFSFFLTSATLPSSVSTFTATGVRGHYLYARVRAKNTDGDISNWTLSDGIYINRRIIDGSISDWSFPVGPRDSIVISNEAAFWRDGLFDQRTDQISSTQLDIASFAVTLDEYNMYLFIGFNSTTTIPQFDGRNFIQVLVDSENKSNERVFRGRGDRYEDSYSANSAAWEWLCEIVSGNDQFRVEDNLFSNRRYGRYSEGAGTNNSNSYYEVAMPLSYMGGKDKFLGKSVKFTVAMVVVVMGQLVIGLVLLIQI
ncbi:MAG: hypothetical protein NZ870_02005 [bacterium]|nr:hypothetical protein [bacterium]